MSEITIAIMMGSKSDMPVMELTGAILKDFGVSYEMKVLSAHRTPRETVDYTEGLKARGVKAVICAAGMSAALPGVVAAHTTLPVIGVPLNASDLNGMDALLSIAQMPPGVPVGCVAVGKAGAKNAAFLALRILAVSDAGIEKKLIDYRESEKKKILEG